MKNRGFALVETIVVVVVLVTALLILYTSYGKILQVEKTRVYYDDMACIYRTWNVYKKLRPIVSDNYLTKFESNEDYKRVNESDYTSLKTSYGIEKLIIAKGNNLKNISGSYIDDDFKSYIDSIYANSDAGSSIYILIGKYKLDEHYNCYGWVKIG